MKKRKKIIITEKQAKILVSNIITEAQNAYSTQTELHTRVNSRANHASVPMKPCQQMLV
jgi:hypothetical protein